MMNFRQRMGWIGVSVYLMVSITAVYYIFEINQTYNRLTLEKTSGTHPPMQRNADSAPSPFSLSSWMQSVKSRLLRMPFWLWAVLFLVPYIQVFLFLYSCTRADPKTVGYCILPVCLALLCNRHASFTKASNQISRLQLIDT
ncbi:transmembrane protein 251 [Tachysurus ichikawai]